MSLPHAISPDIFSFFSELVIKKMLASVADYGMSGLPSCTAIERDPAEPWMMGLPILRVSVPSVVSK